MHPFRPNAATGGWWRSSLGDLPSDGGYVMSVPISAIPRLEPIWLNGGDIISADRSLGVGENGIGGGLVGFRLLQVGLRLLQEHLPHSPITKAHFISMKASFS